MKTKLMIESIFIATILLTVCFLTVVSYRSAQIIERTSNDTSISDDWYYLPAFPNYAPSGLPDFSQKQQDDWKDLIGQQAFCGSVCLADILWWFDSKHETQSGYAGDGNDTYPLVQDYHAPGMPIPGLNSDDHNYNNVNDNQTPFFRFRKNGELIEQVAWYANRQKDMIRYEILGPFKGFFNAFKLLYGIKQWLLDCNLPNNYSVKPIFKPSFSTIVTYLRNNSGIILGIDFPVHKPDFIPSFLYWGHLVAVAGINPLGYIAVSDPYLDKMNPSVDPYEHNNASIVSHDVYRVNLTSPYPGIASWWLPDYRGGGAIIIGAIVISEKS